MNKIFIYTFYRFIKIIDKNKLKKEIDNFLSEKSVRGTILLADEGINGSISSDKENLDKLVLFIKKKINIRKLEIKINNSDFVPFNRMKVRTKKEIVTLGKADLKVEKLYAKKIDPKYWDKIVKSKNTVLIDVRNKFEIKIGKFKNSINPNTDSFRDFPKFVSRLKIEKNAKIAMYCTGGIRCEKASAYLKTKGYKNILQLKGGIIEYLKYNSENKKNSLWDGECFVFDNRVAVNKKLAKGKYTQCFGCRRPLTKKDVRSYTYKKGIHCPYCINERSEKQIKSSESRQSQINIYNKKNIDHVFKKIKNID